MIRVPLVSSRGMSAVLFLPGMQMRQSQVTGDNPLCPVDPQHLIHGHGSYTRCGDDDVLKPTEVIPRWLCLPCGHTISVLPDHLLPY